MLYVVVMRVCNSVFVCTSDSFSVIDMGAIPNLCVCVAGMGDMAVSNSIGSNIFDVLLGLGFPWVLRTLVVDYGSVVRSTSLSLSVV